jgi:hypothetical protein
MKSILDPSFKYTSSMDTDIAKTFARVRRMQRQSVDAVAASIAAERLESVTAFHRPPRRDAKVA